MFIGGDMEKVSSGKVIKWLGCIVFLFVLIWFVGRRLLTSPEKITDAYRLDLAQTIHVGDSREDVIAYLKLKKIWYFNYVEEKGADIPLVWEGNIPSHVSTITALKRQRNLYCSNIEIHYAFFFDRNSKLVDYGVVGRCNVSHF